MSLLEKEKTGKKIIDLRLKLRNEIRKLIDRIVIYPVGLHFVTREFAQKALEDLSVFFQEGTKEYSDIKKYYHDRLEHPKEFRLFKIFFKSGSVRTIYPAREQLGIPLSFDFDNEEKVKERIDFSRFVLSQDKGTAIAGPGRVDIFCGFGTKAEYTAGTLKEKGELYLLLKK